MCEPRPGTTPRDDFEDPTERVAFALLLIDQLDHALLSFRITATQRRVVCNGGDLIEGKFQRLLRNSAELNHVTANLNAKVCEQLFRHRATGNPRRRLAGGSTFQHITQIARVVFQSAGQIGVARDADV